MDFNLRAGPFHAARVHPREAPFLPSVPDVSASLRDLQTFAFAEGAGPVAGNRFSTQFRWTRLPALPETCLGSYAHPSSRARAGGEPPAEREGAKVPRRRGGELKVARRVVAHGSCPLARSAFPPLGPGRLGVSA